MKSNVAILGLAGLLAAACSGSGNGSSGSSPGTDVTAGAAGTGAAAGASGNPSGAGPSFAKYSAPTMVTDEVTFSNGQIAGQTFHFFIANTGGSGTATVSVSYQGYTETKPFDVESGMQYVLASKTTLTSSGDSKLTADCIMTVDVPGLTITVNHAVTTATKGLKCSVVAGASTSALIPLSACTCSGGCPPACSNDCGLLDQGCCGGCLTPGKTCQGGMCQ